MSRVHLALDVNDIDEAVAFYSKLFGTEPAKLRPGYANFAIDEPPLKLVLLENPGIGGALNHLGIEVPDTDTVDAEQARLAEAGLASVDERDTTCCYARQDNSGCRARRMGGPGRSTRSWPTARPSTAKSPTVAPAAAAAPARPGSRPLPRSAASSMPRRADLHPPAQPGHRAGTGHHAGLAHPRRPGLRRREPLCAPASPGPATRPHHSRPGNRAWRNAPLRLTAIRSGQPGQP